MLLLQDLCNFVVFTNPGEKPSVEKPTGEKPSNLSCGESPSPSFDACGKKAFILF